MLKERIRKDFELALKNHQDLKRLVLGSLISAIHNKEIEKRTLMMKKDMGQKELGKIELSDEEIISVIQSEIKKRKEAIELFQNGNRYELAQKEKSELDILINYLPRQLSEEELRQEVKEAISLLGAKKENFGKIIGYLMNKLKGMAEGSFVAKIVKEELSKL